MDMDNGMGIDWEPRVGWVEEGEGEKIGTIVIG